MSRQISISDKAFGYLTAVESEEHGYFGGYLVVSHLGRPLEFHCTAPIRPSRAQQILYGPTLEPYLLGEQISGALLSAAKLSPCVILTDCTATLHARERFEVPMALLLNAGLPDEMGAVHASPSERDARTASNDGGAEASESSAASTKFTIGEHQLQLPFGYEQDEPALTDALSLLAQHVSLAEPFARIRDAIREAQRIGGRGTEAHDQAA
jgi:hypothetical protein